MNIYDAILAAADHIERHPEEFDFYESGLPDKPNCGTPTCAVGWVATFAKIPVPIEGRVSIYEVVTELFGVHELILFRQLDRINISLARKGLVPPKTCKDEWRERSDICAKVLRAYANKYHAPQPPDWEALAKPDAGIREEERA